jgi:DNA-binding transcriptional MocR family regulator
MRFIESTDKGVSTKTNKISCEVRRIDGIRITFGSVLKEDIPRVVDRIGKTINDMSKE